MLIAQVSPSKGSQIPRCINQKLSVTDVVFLGESVEKRRHGIGPAAAVHLNFDSVSIAAYNHFSSPST